MRNDQTRRASKSAFWYSLVAASPIPERGEAVNVAVLLGNGAPYAIRFLDRLPRLACIAASDEINVYQAVLEGIAEAIEHGATLESLAVTLGPQMFLRKPRALFHEPSAELFDRLERQFLAPPSQPVRRINEEALIRRSLAKLDEEIAKSRIKGVTVAHRVRPKSLYEGKLDRYVAFRVPPIARALRSFGRDVLLDGLVVEETHDPVALRSSVSRIGQAFYAYDKLRKVIRERTSREIRTVGVLQPGSPSDSEDTRAMREFIKEMWSHHALVIDGDQESIEAQLHEQMKWVAGAA